MRDELMEKVWELYALATGIINKLCKNKCFHLGESIVEECYDYLRMRLEKNEFQALKNYDPSKGAKETTYLYMLVSSRIIDFMNSSKHQRELIADDSINERSEELDSVEADVMEIAQKLLSMLKYEEQTYFKYRYVDELSYQEIGDIFDLTAKQASKKLENIKNKLKTKAQKAGLRLEDIL